MQTATGRPSPPVHHAPINVQEHLRTIMFCLNRILGEPGLSRKIAGYHKDLLVDDVKLRIESTIQIIRTEQTLYASNQAPVPESAWLHEVLCQ